MANDAPDVLALRQLVALRRSGREAVEALSLVEEGLPPGELRAEFTRARQSLGGGGPDPSGGLAGQLAQAVTQVQRLEMIAQAAETRWETRAALHGARRMLITGVGGSLAFFTVVSWLLPLELFGDVPIPGVIELALQALRYVGLPLVLAVLVGGPRLPLSRVPGGPELDRAAELLAAAANPTDLGRHLASDEAAVVAAADGPEAGVEVLALALATEGRRKHARFLATAPTIVLAVAAGIGFPLLFLAVRGFNQIFTL